jgi:predicted TIM-barrel fold metal-dependent hydrolase
MKDGGQRMIVDTHAHIYSPDETAYPPIEKPYRPPAGTGSPEHLRREAAAAGVDRVMMVQTTTFYGWDNRFVRDTAPAAREWAVGVCTLDPEYPHSTDVLYALAQRSNVRALRTYASGGSGQERRYDHPGNRRLYAEAREVGIVINALLNAGAADQLAQMLADFPDQPVVLDHCLALSAGRNFDATVAAVVDLARFPNLTAKLTFLPTGSAEEYPFRDMHGALRRFVDAYGPERCIWGSDFPCELWCPKVTYAGHLQLFKEELGLSAAEQAAILGDTAARLYRL